MTLISDTITRPSTLRPAGRRRRGSGGGCSCTGCGGRGHCGGGSGSGCCGQRGHGCRGSSRRSRDGDCSTGCRGEGRARRGRRPRGPLQRRRPRRRRQPRRRGSRPRGAAARRAAALTVTEAGGSTSVERPGTPAGEHLRLHGLAMRRLIRRHRGAHARTPVRRSVGAGSARRAAGRRHRLRPARRPPCARTQELAVFVHGQTAMAKPDSRSAASRLGRAKPPDHRRADGAARDRPPHRQGRHAWLQVRLPGRPNGSTGWIRKARTTRSATAWHLVVDLSERRLTVYRQGRLFAPSRASSGPRRRRPPWGSTSSRRTSCSREGRSAGRIALALSARSYVFQEFAGGPGQIAVHGVWNVGGTMGTAASHGCVRLDTAAITWLGERIGPGVPCRRVPSAQISQAPSRWTSSSSTCSSPPGRRSLTMSQCTALSFFPPVYV